MYEQQFQKWLNNAVLDNDLCVELNSISNDSNEISDRFYKDLYFGTGGLRGIIGAGTNRMNVYTVGRATQGLALYVKALSNTPKVAIAYDSRIKSTLFAETAAAILAENGIKVYIYSELMPTPMLSYAVRELDCDAGIVITASHNPSIYNGYKVYGNDGCQLGPDASDSIMKYIQKTDYFKDIKFGNFKTNLTAGNIEYIKQDLIDSYLAAVKKQSVLPSNINLKDLKIIYTPLHGTGNKPVRAILKSIGINNVTVVKEQELPDGNFPTAPYPNPEIKQPYEIALKYAEKENADLILATDPDCDRVGIAVKYNGEYKLMTGNDVGALLLNYLLECRKNNGTLTDTPVAVKTIVTTEICQKICDDYGCKLINVLTGFKFIGEQIALLEKAGKESSFVLGYEESYGYLPAGYVRDKDAVVASMLICEMAAYYKAAGFTLIDKLEELFKKYGYYINTQQSFAFEGQSGMEKMKNIMSEIRNSNIKNFAKDEVISVDDYKTSITKNNINGSELPITLPKSNVICFNLKSGGKVIFRPSGTEPKIKIYIGVTGDSRKSCNEKIELIKQQTEELMKK